MTFDIKNRVDSTRTTAWGEMTQKFSDMEKKGFTLREAFGNNPGRAEALSFIVNDFYIDLSKNLIDEELLDIFSHLAKEIHLEEMKHAMFEGQHLNVTEDRSVLHTALRRPEKERGNLLVDGHDIIADVRDTLARIYHFVDSVRNGIWRGITGKKIKTVVNIGIGGSDLGPRMVYDALQYYADAGVSARFISNIDPNDSALTLEGLDPETTLFIVVSKTFTTLETMTNASVARTWLLSQLKEKGCIKTDDEERNAIERHFVAVSTNKEKVKEFGICSQNMFSFWNWVGGRYSVDSAVGTVVALAIGKEHFEEFLQGMNAVDTYFLTTPHRMNVIDLMGIMNVWYTDFYRAETHAILPYNQYLRRFPAYLQQLTMESNGKSVRIDGSPVRLKTGEIFWGEPGTNGQHSFYQLIHQGTHFIPADFIAFANTYHPVQCEGQDMQELLLSNFLAQTQALAFGKTAEEVSAEGVPDFLVPAKVFAGNRPSTSIFGDELTPFSLGELISLYEHIVFVEGAVWGINSYDQWGVELGKVLARDLVPKLKRGSSLEKEDMSTSSLIEWYRSRRR